LVDTEKDYGGGEIGKNHPLSLFALAQRLVGMPETGNFYFSAARVFPR